MGNLSTWSNTGAEMLDAELQLQLGAGVHGNLVVAADKDIFGRQPHGAAEVPYTPSQASLPILEKSPLLGYLRAGMEAHCRT